jgi:hypothetical protein
MTSLLAWVGVDSRGPSSCYLASDSRISWGKNTYFDCGRKLFTCAHSADLFGYCGDVLFPSLLLSQISELIDRQSIVGEAVLRHAALLSLAKTSFENYPESQRRAFTILHCTRNSTGMSSSFHLWRTDWSPTTSWLDQEIDLPTSSAIILAIGTGKNAIASNDALWRQSEVGRTSRAVFSAFCDSLQSGEDHYSGGAPQLVGLYRTRAGETIGAIYRDARFLLGVPMTMAEADLMDVEWRNELFERCDGSSMKLLQGAQRHARPERPWKNGKGS